MRVIRRLVHALLWVLALLAGATVAVVVVSQTAWFKNSIRGYIVREANQYLNGTLSIDRLDGNLFFGVEMKDIAVSMDGSPVVTVKDLRLDYNVFELVSKGLSVDHIRLNKPVLYLRRRGDSWSISRVIKREALEADRRGPGRTISIADIGVSDGSAVIDGSVGTTSVAVPRHVDHFDAKLAFKYEPVHYSIDIAHVSFRGSDPPLALNALSGGISVRNDTVYVKRVALRTQETSLLVDGAVQQYLAKPIVNLQLTSDKLSVPELARLVPSLTGVRLQPAWELKLNGPLDRLSIDVRVRSSAGQAAGNIVADFLAPRQSAAGTVSLRHVDLSPILNNPRQKSDITAEAKVDIQTASFSDVRSYRGTLSVTAPRIVAAGIEADQVKANARISGRVVAIDARASGYGSSATAAGHITLPANKLEAVAFDVHGHARDVDLRRLPPDWAIPAAVTNINSDYHVAGSITNTSNGVPGSGRTTAMTAEARFGPSTVAGAAIAGGSTATVTIKGKEMGYQTDLTVAGLDLQRVAEEFHVPALAADRYKSSINGRVTASGHGGTPLELEVTANGVLTDASIMSGHVPQLAFTAAVRQDTVHVNATGSFAGIDPAVISGKAALKGAISGVIDLDATVAEASQGVTRDRVQGTVKAMLESSTVGGLEITKATLDGDYRDSTADFRALDIVGRDVNVQASGTLAVGETAQSNLKVRADSPSLEQIGNLVKRPLAGIGKLDATVTGNAREWQATGNFTGDGVKYGGAGALAISTDFTAKLPDLDFASANVSAKTHGTFVTVIGQNINDLTATTDYASKRVNFDATAKQPQRMLEAAGTLVLHPDHQEVHVQRLAVVTQEMTWQTIPGSTADVRYADDTVRIEHFRLVNGEQQIVADGTLGPAGEPLKVTFQDVDIEAIDALLLRPPQFSGRLNATSTVTGTKDAPHVKAEFTIGQGGFRQFHYDSFGGTVEYSAKTIVLDAKLQQNATNWIQATGEVPLALFKGWGESSHERVDLQINSSAIDLGLVQGFTTELTGVHGTLEAHVDVTGTAEDPHPAGVITVQNAAFKVESTGVVYTGLDGKIDLLADRVHIDQIRVLDNQRRPLTLTGDLAIHEYEIGGVSVAMKAHDFKIIDNDMGNVRIDGDLRLTGELNAPRIEGDLGVHTGQINLDPILNLLGTSAYATTPTEHLTQPNDAPAAATDKPGMPGMFDALQIDVHVTVPNALVIKSSDLRAAPDAPLSLGALNVTLGGDLWASKVPYDQIRLTGVVNTVRGTYDFQGRRFEILRDGTLRFAGLDELDPALDIRSQRVIQAVTANVSVRGTFSRPTIELSSTPPLEQADILSLIVFNQPINQIGEGQQVSLVQRAQALATGAAAGGLANSIGNALNLDVFEINTAPDSRAAAQLTVGQQLGQNLFVKVQQGLGDQSQTNFILEYELTKWLRLQTNVLQGAGTEQQLFRPTQGSDISLLFFFSY